MVYESIIGLEIHAELATPTKLFCACKNDPFHAPEPNIYICPVCLGLPGALPVLNRTAVLWAIKVGLALGCTIGHGQTNQSQQRTNQKDSHQVSDRSTKWDRKNYFYPDLPKGYQISQYDLPLAHGGKLPIDGREIAITRIHLEEDTGKLLHPADASYSLVDYNRSGVPLLELVTEPELRTGFEAAEFAQLYQLVLRTLGVATADMEKGGMRVEVNISLRPKTQTGTGNSELGTKVEIKNLNSFRSVRAAIDYEIKRQTDLLARGKRIVQETRGWDESRQMTFAQRVKETAADYRYFPEPDLPPITLSDHQGDSFVDKGIDLKALKLDLPELPWQKMARYQKDWGLASTDASRLVLNIRADRRFELERNALPAVYQDDAGLNQRLAKWLINQSDWDQVAEGSLAELLVIAREKALPEAMVKQLYKRLVAGETRSPRAIVEAEGIAPVGNDRLIETAVDEAIAAHPKAVSDYRAGKTQAVGFLVGQVMAKTRGAADPTTIRTLIEHKLKEGR